MLAESHFKRNDKRYNFNNPSWFVVKKDDDKGLSDGVDAVIDFLSTSGGIVQEVFGMNFWDLVELDRDTYIKIKTRVYKIQQERAKAYLEQQEKSDRALQAEAQRQQQYSKR